MNRATPPVLVTGFLQPVRPLFCSEGAGSSGPATALWFHVLHADLAVRAWTPCIVSVRMRTRLLCRPCITPAACAKRRAAWKGFRSADGCLPGFVRLLTSQSFWLRRLTLLYDHGLAHIFGQSGARTAVYRALCAFPHRSHSGAGVWPFDRRGGHSPSHAWHGNWSGSDLIYTLLFDHGIAPIFDQSGVRTAVYSNWWK